MAAFLPTSGCVIRSGPTSSEETNDIGGKGPSKKKDDDEKRDNNPKEKESFEEKKRNENKRYQEEMERLEKERQKNQQESNNKREELERLNKEKRAKEELQSLKEKVKKEDEKIISQGKEINSNLEIGRNFEADLSKIEKEDERVKLVEESNKKYDNLINEAMKELDAYKVEKPGEEEIIKFFQEQTRELIESLKRDKEEFAKNKPNEFAEKKALKLKESKRKSLLQEKELAEKSITISIFSVANARAGKLNAKYDIFKRENKNVSQEEEKKFLIDSFEREIKNFNQQPEDIKYFDLKNITKAIAYSLTKIIGSDVVKKLVELNESKLVFDSLKQVFGNLKKLLNDDKSWVKILDGKYDNTILNPHGKTSKESLKDSLKNSGFNAGNLDMIINEIMLR